MYVLLLGPKLPASTGFFIVPMNFLPEIEWFELLCFIVCLNSAGMLPPWIPRPLMPPGFTWGFFFIFFTYWSFILWFTFLIGGNCYIIITLLSYIESFFIRRKGLVWISALAADHQLQLWKLLFVRQNFLLVNLLVGLLLKTLILEASVSHVACIVRIPSRVSRYVILQVWGDRLRKALRTGSYLANVVVVRISQFFEVRVLQNLRCRWPLILVVSNHLHYQVLALLWHMRYQLSYSLELFGLEVEFHVCCMSIRLKAK